MSEAEDYIDSVIGDDPVEWDINPSEEDKEHDQKSGAAQGDGISCPDCGCPVERHNSVLKPVGGKQANLNSAHCPTVEAVALAGNLKGRSL